MNSNCVIGCIRNISSMIEKFIVQEVKAMEYPISKNHIMLFYILPGHGEMMIFNVLCSKWGISKSSLSDIVNKYTDLGFIEKHESNDDKRIVYLRLTSEGDKIRNTLIGLEEDFKNKLFREFQPDQREMFEQLLVQAEKNVNL